METSCKAGKLIISDRSIHIITTIKNVLWSVRRDAVIAVSVERGAIQSTIEFGTAAGRYKAEGVGRDEAQKIALMFI